VNHHVVKASVTPRAKQQKPAVGALLRTELKPKVLQNLPKNSRIRDAQRARASCTSKLGDGKRLSRQNPAEEAEWAKYT